MYSGCLGGVGGVAPLQAVTVDGQDALFIPAQHAQVGRGATARRHPRSPARLLQNFSGMGQVSLVNGQLVRTPVLPAGFLQNVMHLPTAGETPLFFSLLAAPGALRRMETRSF